MTAAILIHHLLLTCGILGASPASNQGEVGIYSTGVPRTKFKKMPDKSMKLDQVKANYGLVTKKKKEASVRTRIPWHHVLKQLSYKFLIIEQTGR